MKNISKLIYVLAIMVWINIHLSIKAQDTWQLSNPTGEIPDAIIGHSMVSIGNKIYLFGGMNNTKSIFNHISIYDNEQQWVKMQSPTPKPSERYNHKAVGYNGKMYVFFGFDGTNKLDDVWYYDVTNNVWHELILNSPKPVARTDFSTLIINNMVWIFGGLDANGNVLNDLWAYNLTDDNWEQYPSFNTTGLSGHISGYGNPFIYFLGGNDNNGLNTQMYCFNTGNYNWSTVTANGDIPQPAANQCFIPYTDDIAFIFSGNTSTGISNNLYKWDLLNNMFTQLAAGPTLENTAGSYIKYSQDKYDTYQSLVFFGGSDGTNIINNTWIYTSDILLTTNINEHKMKDIFVYPNPAINHININCFEEIVKIIIQTSLGQIVYQSNIIDENKRIKISDLSEGFYTITITTKDKKYSKKFAIQR